MVLSTFETNLLADTPGQTLPLYPLEIIRLYAAYLWQIYKLQTALDAAHIVLKLIDTLFQFDTMLDPERRTTKELAYLPRKIGGEIQKFFNDTEDLI